MDELLRMGRLCVGGARSGGRHDETLAKLRKQGQSVAPVTIEGRKIAKSFWGKSWCTNLERYSDYEYRLPRGRTLCPQWFRRRPANREGRDHGEGERFRSLQRQDRHRTGQSGMLEIRLSGLCRNHRFAGRAAAGPLCQRRYGSGLPGGRRAVSVAGARSSCPAAVRTGQTCASTLRRCSMASAPGSTKSLQLLFELRGVDENELIASAGEDLSLAKAATSGGEGARRQ